MRTHLEHLAAAALAATLATLTWSAPLHAQAEPATIPATLAHALLDPQFYSRTITKPSIVVGEAPAGFPADLVPPSMTVIGGMANGTRIVVIMRDSTQPPLGVYQRFLQARGFTAPPASNSGFGFASSGTPGNFLCRDSAMVTPTVVRDANNSPMLSVTYERRGGFGCLRPSYPAPVGQKPRLALPQLPPPPGATSNGGGGGTGGDEVHANASLTDSTRIAPALARYYAGLLAADGWSTGIPVGDARLAAVALDAKDSSGRAWTGGLMISSRGKVHTLTLRMTPTEAR